MLHVLTEDQELIRAAAREFAEQEVAPRVAEMEKSNDLPADLLHRCGELGFTGTMFPVEYGGSGLGLTEFAIILEEISRVSQTLAICLDASATLCFLPMVQWGTEEQKQKYLPRACAGELIGAACACEPNGNTNNCMNHTTLAVEGENDWVINGQKIFITNSQRADVFVVYANANGAKTPTLFIVDRDTAGLSVDKPEEKLGWHGSGTGTVYFDDVHVGKDCLLGELHKGNDEVINGVLESCIGIGAMCIGSASAAFRRTYEHVSTREIAGSPLIARQAVAHDIAKMATDIETALALVYKAAAYVDAGNAPLPGTPAGMLASTVKAVVPEMCQKVCNTAIQLHGGLGYTTDIHRYWRDTRACAIGEGPTANHLDFVSLALQMQRNLI